ncbi:hypothetical protein QFW77_18595 [Luteimonas sp. RD2P54]|uniref:Uncharacterized protein n=1 Tax=Luteimonas endophytica TaxID=3042023 RepID=A0ABT6JDT8_9GAMM|nr:hypothetical protein [Luteimonas endophytica]MDH5824980.1 hypothetical protein [Luteimonas endophytica]
MRPQILSLCLCLSLSAAQAAAPPQSSPAARAALDAANGAILRGDSRRAVELLTAAPAGGFHGADRDQRACMLGRLDRARPPWLADRIEDPFVRDVLDAYRRYWWHALAAPAERAALEDALLARLRELLAAAGGAADGEGFDGAESALIPALRERGYHALAGRTAPLRELMLWRTQRTREFDVALPGGSHRVAVDLLDDFVSLGWSGYARCDYGSSGGWATAERLFAVMPGYPDGLDSEKFSVVFLGHEAQHFADQGRYPGLQAWELEYRAKLVELVQAREMSEKRLRGFITAQGDDPDTPHPYANSRVVEDLRARLGEAPDQVPLARLQAAARQLLAEDTARRERERADPGTEPDG